MNKLVLSLLCLGAVSTLAFAGTVSPTPGPLLGAVAGPWGLIAGCVGYGAYRLYKRSR